jgi:ubiquinone/menaquinone biosynthesis C-methylase UbiE
MFRPRDNGHAQTTRRLHLGCGTDIRQGWINLDARKLPGVDVAADLDDCRNTPLPFPDNSINEFFGSHVLEHLRDTLSFMQELHRIARPDAVAVFRVPYGSSDDADEDPTHVRRYFMNSFHYFSQLAYRRADYGYRGDWEVDHLDITVDAGRHAGKSNEQLFDEIRSHRNVVKEMTATLKAVKPIRVPGSVRAKDFRVVIMRVAAGNDPEQR